MPLTREQILAKFYEWDDRILAEALLDYLSPNLILDDESTGGIKVDPDNPTYPWRDLEGILRPDPAGVDRPSIVALNGGAVRAYAYDSNDQMDMVYHIPHDYVPGSDMFIHVHWNHNGTAVSGNMQYTLSYMYGTGHNEGEFGTPSGIGVERSQQFTYDTVDIVTTPQQRHRVDEIQLSSSTPDANQLDSSSIEIDGLLIVNLQMNAIPTITGGHNEPFIHTVDLHYQSTGIGTKNKSPNFYG